MASIYQAINEQREIIRKFVKNSIELSNEMVDLTNDILFFVDCFKSNKFSNEEILELLNDLLEESKEKHYELKKLTNIITRAKEKLDDILISLASFEGLQLIIIEIYQFEAFWYGQTNNIEHLIGKLERGKCGKAFGLIVNIIEKSWKNVGEEYRRYSRDMKRLHID